MALTDAVDIGEQGLEAADIVVVVAYFILVIGVGLTVSSNDLLFDVFVGVCVLI